MQIGHYEWEENYVSAVYVARASLCHVLCDNVPMEEVIERLHELHPDHQVSFLSAMPVSEEAFEMMEERAARNNTVVIKGR